MAGRNVERSGTRAGDWVGGTRSLDCGTVPVGGVHDGAAARRRSSPQVQGVPKGRKGAPGRPRGMRGSDWVLPAVPRGGEGVPEGRVGDLPGFLSGEAGVQVLVGERLGVGVL